MKAKKSMSKEEMDGVFVKLKTEFQLSDIKLEGSQLNPKIGFYASKALYLPIFVFPLSGEKPGVAAQLPAQKPPSVQKGDYIKATHYDGPFLTPGKEVVNAFDARFFGQPTGPVGPPPAQKAIKANSFVQNINPNIVPLHATTNIKSYLRAGMVEAQSSVPRGKGRSGTGETLFGHFGADEEKILTGIHNTNYNGGHLVGDQIMDSHQAFDLYKDWNLAPQQRTFNSPAYTGTIENAVTHAIYQGAPIKYTVTVQYPDEKYNINPLKLVQNLFPPAHKAAQMYRKEVEGHKLKPRIECTFCIDSKNTRFLAGYGRGGSRYTSHNFRQNQNPPKSSF